MSYEIQSKHDFLTGASLIVKIPESELDRKALYTIQTDKPDFILPFRSRCIDGQVEFVYQVGMHSKLQYLSGERLPKEYAELWSGIFSPLLECGDWFMNPYSFVLNTKHLYYDKNNKAVSYIYIPSTKVCSGNAALKEMAAEVSRLISVANSDLENKVLRAIIKDFNPSDFLQMIKSYMAVNAVTMVSQYAPALMNDARQLALVAESLTAPVHELRHESTQENDMKTPSAASGAAHCMPSQYYATEHDEIQSREKASAAPGEIVINFPATGKLQKKKQDSGKNKEVKKENKEKGRKKQKGASSLLGRKIESQQEAVPTAATVPQPDCEPIINTAQVFTPPADSVEITQSTSTEASGVRLRLVGSAALPPVIDVQLEIGGIFTIGRFDAALGKQQSSFEFDKKTKAVSRRHAVIERSEDGYNVIDLSSSAGTFLNGHKLPPNTPCELSYGSRVSFGNVGADYVWEEV